jgi:hypothetical protein
MVNNNSDKKATKVAHTQQQWRDQRRLGNVTSM